MKRLSYLLLLIILASCQTDKSPSQKVILQPSKLDSLNSTASIEKFIHSKDSLLSGYKLKSIKEMKLDGKCDTIGVKIADLLDINKPYYKADFDNNGFEDLLTIGQSYNLMFVFAFMNFGKDSIKQVEVKPNWLAFSVPNIKVENGQTFLEVYTPQLEDNTGNPKIRRDKLLYKFGSFVEFNKVQSNYTIEKIEYSTSLCYGTCPSFDMVINKDKTAFFMPHFYNFSDVRGAKEETGTLKTTLKNKNFDEIIGLLNYINFPTLKDRYAASWSDSATATLKITYNNGKVKTIEDYAMVGTYGLKGVYELIADLRYNQKWK